MQASNRVKVLLNIDKNSESDDIFEYSDQNQIQQQFDSIINQPVVNIEPYQLENASSVKIKTITGKILVADDQLINLEVVKAQLSELNLIDQCEFFLNGLDVYEAALTILEKAHKQSPTSVYIQVVQPISFMLLDSQMPKLLGINVVEKVRKFINESNATELGLKVHLKEPEFVFLTAFCTKYFKKYLKDNNILHCYEKPLQMGQLKTILAVFR